MKNFANRYNLIFDESFTSNSKSIMKYILITKHPEGWVERNVEYLYGLAWNAWIVGMEWVHDCERVKRVISPESYEIKGDNVTKIDGIPRKSRLYNKRKGGLFKNYMFFYKDVEYKGISVSKLATLLIKCGAVDDISSKNSNFSILHVVNTFNSNSKNNQISINTLIDYICNWKPL